MRTRNFVNFFFQKKKVPHPSTRIQIVDHKKLKIDCNQMVNDYWTNKSVNILCREKTTMQHSLNPNDQKVSSWFVKFALYFHYGPRSIDEMFPQFMDVCLVPIHHTHRHLSFHFQEHQPLQIVQCLPFPSYVFDAASTI